MSRDQRRIIFKFKSCNLPLALEQRCILFKFKSCNLPLALETRQYTSPKTPVYNRVCQFCNTNAIEDETHFLIA